MARDIHTSLGLPCCMAVFPFSGSMLDMYDTWKYSLQSLVLIRRGQKTHIYIGVDILTIKNNYLFWQFHSGARNSLAANPHTVTFVRIPNSSAIQASNPRQQQLTSNRPHVRLVQSSPSQWKTTILRNMSAAQSQVRSCSAKVQPLCPKRHRVYLQDSTNDKQVSNRSSHV